MFCWKSVTAAWRVFGERKHNFWSRHGLVCCLFSKRPRKTIGYGYVQTDDRTIRRDGLLFQRLQSELVVWTCYIIHSLRLMILLLNYCCRRRQCPRDDFVFKFRTVWYTLALLFWRKKMSRTYYTLFSYEYKKINYYGDYDL